MRGVALSPVRAFWGLISILCSVILEISPPLCGIGGVSGAGHPTDPGGKFFRFFFCMELVCGIGEGIEGEGGSEGSGE